MRAMSFVYFVSERKRPGKSSTSEVFETEGAPSIYQ